MKTIERAFIAVATCCVSLGAHAQSASDGQSEREHVAPDAPARTMPAMTYREMTQVMDMDDRRPYHRFLMDRLEAQRTQGSTGAAWDGEFFWGGDYQKVGIRSEGQRSRGAVEDARIELVWDRIFSRWWSAQLGIRHDWGEGPTRDWLSVGTQGLAPYFFNIRATAYLGEGGRTALRFSVDYDLLLTQRLVLQPRTEINAYGKDDPARGLKSGISDGELGIRLRYELRREIAPYFGVSWARALGNTSDLRRARGEDPGQWKLLAGLRLNF